MYSSSALPLISIVLATYNPNIEFFIKQIDSLKQQTYINWECVIVDDCSTSEKFLEIKKVVFDDQRFSLYCNKVNIRSYHTFEEGLKLVSKDADLICFCDQDDIWLPNKLEKLAKEFDDSKVSCVHSDLSLIDSQDNLLHESCWKFEGRNTHIYDTQLLILRNTITGCSMMFRREVLELALPFPSQQIKNSFHHDLWIALISLQYGSIKPLHESLVQYRQHGNNVVGAKKGTLFSFVENLVNKANPLKEFHQRCLFQLNSRMDLIKKFKERVRGNLKGFDTYSELFSLACKSVKYRYNSFRFIFYCLLGKFFSNK